MKNSTKRILRGLLVIFAIIFVEGGISYFSNHSYYGRMLSLKNFGLLISAFGAAAIPLRYLKNQQKPELRSLLIRIAAGLATFNLLHEIISGTLLNLLSSTLLSRNTLLLFGLGVTICGLIFILGSFIATRLNLFKSLELRETLLCFALGLVSFLVVIQVLMGFGILYWQVVVLFLCGIAGLARFEKPSLHIHQNNIESSLKTLHQQLQGKFQRIILALLGASFAYFFFGFNHSLIPYPTARDANHEYMYIPKVIAENAGILRGNNGPGGGMPYLWHAFITFAFVLRKPLSVFSNYSADTFAVNMNFWSGLFVLFFGLAAIKESLKCFGRSPQDDDPKNETAFYLSWGLLLAWLSSGMGAFLLFVDNKTDMGVLSLTVMALFAGFSCINLILSKTGKPETNKTLIYLVLSAIFFGFAIIAKPTAFIDVVVFALLLIGLSLNSTASIGVGVMTIGLMGIIQPLYASAFTNPTLGKIILLLGVAIFIVGAIRGIINKKEHFTQWIKNIIIWGATLLLTIIIFKGPRAAYQKILNNDNNRASFPKTLILGQASPTDKKQTEKSKFSSSLLATNNTIENIESQSTIDTQIINETTKNLTLHQCKTTEFNTEELNQNLQTAPGSTLREDFGRYVGFNSKNFSRSGAMGLLLKIFFWNEGCYGLNKDAVLLCQNRDKLTNPSLQNLNSLQTLFKNREGKVKNLIESGFNLSGTMTLDTVFSELETYYQEHSILATANEVNIPYRYLVPINAVFNRSLQNLSSYYTDIGLIWIFILLLLIAGLSSSVFSLNKKLITLLAAISIGWIVRWTIAAGIVRYGLGLMLWIIIGIAAFIDKHLNTEKKSESRDLIIIFISFLILSQLTLNFMRIGSQAGSGPFGWYKNGVGIQQNIGNALSDIQQKKKIGYNAKNVFDLQFGQYLPVINNLKERKNEDGVLIAGTYIQYFLDNQKNVRLDGLLSRLWEQMSDYNSCKSYKRLTHEHVKYLVIDPNIGTVGRVGAGNESLFHRFFAKMDEKETTIQTHGAMTMLAQFVQDGYAKLLFTNNIGAKYAFALTDAELKAEFGEMTKDDLILLRAKLAVAKFFITQQDMSLLEHINALVLKRLPSSQGLEDLANLFNKKIDADKLYLRVNNYLQMRTGDFSSLNEDEKIVVYQYLSFLHMMQTGNGQSQLASLIQESIFGSSQIIALEMN